MVKKSRNRQPWLVRPDYGLLWVPVFIFFLMLSGLAVFYVWERIKLRELSRDLIQHERHISMLQEENNRLRGQVEELSSYRRIYQIASQRFGFVELKPKIVYIDEQPNNSLDP